MSKLTWLAALAREFGDSMVAALTGRGLAPRVETESKRLHTLL